MRQVPSAFWSGIGTCSRELQKHLTNTSYATDLDQTEICMINNANCLPFTVLKPLFVFSFVVHLRRELEPRMRLFDPMLPPKKKGQQA